jgi:hypothetical protein
MAKRARGTVRPGQRRPVDRRPATTRPASPASAAAPATIAPRPSGLTEAEEQRAAEIERELLAQERAAEAARTRTRERTTREVAYSGTGGGSLAVRAEEEYAYVARDVKHIVRIAAILLTVLFGIWILVDVAKVIPVG